MANVFSGTLNLAQFNSIQFIAEGRRDVLVSRNLATAKHPI